MRPRRPHTLLAAALVAVMFAPQASAQTNLALAGTASQSTTYPGGDAFRGNDGNTDPNWSAQSVCHTNNQMNSYWEVDLGGTFPVSEIRLFNRGDCCGNRLSNFRVSVFDGTNEVFGQDFFAGAGSVAIGGIVRVLPASTVMGDRVRVGFNGFNNLGNGYLHLAEVEVYDERIGTNYCAPGVANSSGAAGSIAASGSLSVADNDLSIAAFGLPANAFGFFLTSQNQGMVQQPGGSQGVLCLGGGIGRYVGPGQIQDSGQQGTFALPLDLNQVPTPTGLVAVVAGETWNFQAWHRDLVGGSTTSNFTDALALTLN